jgi:putative ABC transport system substrate-binding protein
MGGLLEGDVGGVSELNAFREEMRVLGWNVGGNLQLEYRWPGTDAERVRVSARELADSHVEVILSRATVGTAALVREAPAVPVVFVLVVEPVTAGFVQSLVRPGGNVTGFSNFEASIGGKWVDLLKQMAPSVSRIGLLFNPRTAPFAEAFLESAKAAGHLLDASVTMAPVANDQEIERTIVDFARDSRGGIIGITDAFVTEHREVIVSLTAKHRVPAVYGNRIIARSGGLASYAADYPDLFRRAAGYIDRILKGAKPAELPVQPPSKFELSINLKTAKGLGLNIPPQLVGLANEVIE